MPTPDTISDLILWLNAETLDATLNDTDPVATWADQSGQGNDATQATSASRPTFHTNVINGLPVVRFFGTTNDTHLELPDLLTGSAAAEVFIVVAMVADPPSSSADTGLWRFGSAGQPTHYPFTDGNVYDAFATNSRKSTGNPSQDLTQFHVYNISSAASSWVSRFNNVQHFSTTSNTVGFTTTPIIGGADFTNVWMIGDVAEVVLYSRVLTGTERTDVYEYLDQRYFQSGISGTLAETEDDDTLSASGTVTPPLFSGTLAETEEDDTLAASGTFTPPDITGTLAVTEADDTVAASGTFTPDVISGTLAETEDDDSLSAAGSVTAPQFSGSLAEVEADDTLVATGTSTYTVSGTVSVTEEDDTLVATGSLPDAEWWVPNPVGFTRSPVGFTPKQ